MARLSAEELLGRLEKGKPIPAILLLGEEPYLRDACRAVPSRRLPNSIDREICDRSIADLGGVAVFGGAR